MFMTSRKNPDKGPTTIVKNPRERSFSLVETIVAVSLIAFLMIEVSGVHGNAINFADYSRKALQASYLAKRLMAQIEYNASIRTPIKDMAGLAIKEQTFDDAPDFQYSLSIEPLPHSIDLMFKVMSGGLLGGGEKKDSGGEKGGGVGAMLDQIKPIVQTAVGEDPIWIAKVNVSWAEGAKRSSVDLGMIITDIKKLEGTLVPLISKGAPPATGGTTGGGTTGTTATGTATGTASGTATGGTPATGTATGGASATATGSATATATGGNR
jgi:hypothetical protein